MSAKREVLSVCVNVDRNKVTKKPHKCCTFRANRKAKSTSENECTNDGDIHKYILDLHLHPQIEPSYCLIQLVTL